MVSGRCRKVEPGAGAGYLACVGSSFEPIIAFCDGRGSVLQRSCCGITRRAIGNRSCSRTLLRRTRQCPVNAEGLPKPENSQQHHEHQRQDRRCFGNLCAARLKTELLRTKCPRRLSFKQGPECQGPHRRSTVNEIATPLGIFSESGSSIETRESGSLNVTSDTRMWPILLELFLRIRLL